MLLNSAKIETTTQETLLTLTPRIHPLLERFLEEKRLVQDLARALGSPLNILFPELVHDNVQSFCQVFTQHGLQGRVFFAHKSNQSDCITRRLALEKASLDISSSNELRHALGAGFTGSRLEATGPKNKEFVYLALQHGVTISIDNLEELRLILVLRSALSLASPSKILLRLSGFDAEHSKFLNKGSRFGIALSELDEAFRLLEENKKEVEFLGFAFHLDTVSILERAVAIENCLQLYEESVARGFEPRVLNIGGGYKINYLANEKEWNEYTSALKEAVLGTGKSISWQGNSFGMSADKGKLRGNFNSYTYFDSLVGAKFLNELLSHEFPNMGNRSAASMLRDNMIELWIEPGRSLLDQTGITLASVNTVRRSSRGEHIIILNMKRQDISFLDQEIFVDPLIIYQDNSMPQIPERVPVFFAGNLCLESDLVYRHMTFLPKLPQAGDLVAFINTAGYFMDFSASHSIMQPLARKVAVCQRNGEFVWTADDQYFPLWDTV